MMELLSAAAGGSMGAALLVRAASMAAGAGLDLLFGDPIYPLHPVRLVGRLIAGLEKSLRRLLPKTPGGELAGGAALTVLVTGITAGAVFGALRLAGAISPVLDFAVRAVLIWLLLAMRSLRDESDLVRRELDDGNLPGARRALSMIVGRETASLGEAGIVRAAVETVAENCTDGVITPLVWLAIGGPVLGWAAKAVNTMDSMVGYKNEKYLYFGRCAARLDDAVNYLPARAAALLLIAACLPARLDAAGAFRIWRRDGHLTGSPNAGQTEAAAAGALGIALGGPAVYFGRTLDKPWLGDDLREPEAKDIRRAHALLYGAGLLGLGIALLCLWAVSRFLG